MQPECTAAELHASQLQLQASQLELRAESAALKLDVLNSERYLADRLTELHGLLETSNAEVRNVQLRQELHISITHAKLQSDVTALGNDLQIQLEAFCDRARRTAQQQMMVAQVAECTEKLASSLAEQRDALGMRSEGSLQPPQMPAGWAEGGLQPPQLPAGSEEGSLQPPQLAAGLAARGQRRPRPTAAVAREPSPPRQRQRTSEWVIIFDIDADQEDIALRLVHQVLQQVTIVQSFAYIDEGRPAGRRAVALVQLSSESASAAVIMAADQHLQCRAGRPPVRWAATWLPRASAVLP